MRGRVQFIWGAGGVGKSHVAVRKACGISAESSAVSVPEAQKTTLLMTMDPSLRIFELLQLDPQLSEDEVKIGEFSFHVRRTDEGKFFDQLNKLRPAEPQVRVFYDRMSKGLQDFRDYISLLQLADELSRDRFERVVVDTPPFQEALGLHRSIFNLRDFFEKSLVQLALKSSSKPWIQTTVKKIFNVTRIFVGKAASRQVFDFIEWLSSHADRFQVAAKSLEALVFSDSTDHLFVLTPETSFSFLKEVAAVFGKKTKVSFIINRSAAGFKLPEGNSSFHREIEGLQKREEKLIARLEREFGSVKVSRIPMMLMGEDTEQEMLKFVKSNS